MPSRTPGQILAIAIANLCFLIAGFVCLANVFGFTAALGFTSLAVYCRNDND